MKEEGLIQRIQQLMDMAGENRKQFATKLGYDVSNFSQIMNGNRNVPRSLLNKIAEYYPEVDRGWLYEGIGDAPIIHVGDIPSFGNNEQRKELRPRLPVAAAAGGLSVYAEGVKREQCEMLPVVRNFPSYDYTMFIKGNSMLPKFESGDEIAIKKVEIIEWGNEYVLDTADGAIFKKIYDEGDSIRCVSYSSEEYPDFLIRKDLIYGYYKCVGILRVL